MIPKIDGLILHISYTRLDPLSRTVAILAYGRVVLQLCRACTFLQFFPSWRIVPHCTELIALDSIHKLGLTS